MASLPATLLYFVIYNPSLRPAYDFAGSEDKDEREDAEEQAQVLFYTAKDHAVSKDRVLRQVGLAKALVNFSNMFGTQDTCESVHSQCRRMLMLQPETDYWIHACIELSKTSRPPAREDKSSKAKAKHGETQYDYSDVSLHDGALRAQLQLAYESFKMKHGTFSSVLARLGKEALELQLERFFTVWSWSWNLEKTASFSEYVGVRIHPLSNQLLPIIEASLVDNLPPHLTAIIIVQDQFITTRDKASQYPPYLARHLLNILSPSSAKTETYTSVSQDGDHAMSNEADSIAAMSDKEKNDNADLGRKGPPKGGTFGKRLLAVPPLNVSMNATMSAMDVRKWNWPGYLTFGGSKDDQSSDEVAKAPSTVVNLGSVSVDVKDNAPAPSTSSVTLASLHGRAASVSDVPVDSQALLDAISNSQPSSTTPRTGPVTSDASSVDESNELTMSRKHNEVESTGITTEIQEASHSSHNMTSISQDLVEDSKASLDVGIDGGESATNLEVAEAATEKCNATNKSDGNFEDGNRSKNLGIPSDALPSFNTTRVYLQFDDSIECKPSQIRYLCHAGLLIAFTSASGDDTDEDEDQDLAQYLALCSQDLLERLRSVIDDEERRITATLQPSTVQTVLQKSQFIIALTPDTSYTSPSFSSTSWQLHEARKAFECSPDMVEVYSRRQNPQDWHLAKRIGMNKDSTLDKVVYMEIGRKEASLPDVDGELAGVVRRYFSSSKITDERHKIILGGQPCTVNLATSSAVRQIIESLIM